MDVETTKSGEAGTRQRIMEVAARSFAEFGYARTSIRDIAAELGISNPSLYYHFRSKGELLAELLVEPPQRVAHGVSAADHLSGDERTKAMTGGLLDAFEVQSGIVITGFCEINQIPEPYGALAASKRPKVIAMLSEGTAQDEGGLRATMALARVEGAVLELMRTSPAGHAFVDKLRGQRDSMVGLAQRILR